MMLVFPVRYEVRGASNGRGWVQRGELTIRAHTQREARVLAREQIRWRCGARNVALEVGAPR